MEYLTFVGADHLAIKAEEKASEMVDFDGNLSNLQRGMNILKGRLVDVTMKAEPHSPYKSLVDSWIAEAKDLITKADLALTRSKDHAGAARILDAGKVAKLMTEINELVAFDIESTVNSSIHPKDSMPKMYRAMDFEWYEAAFNSIMREKRGMICVYGQPGSGISSFLTYLNRRLVLEYETVFYLGEEVDTINKMQDELGYRLKLDETVKWEAISTSYKRSLINSALKRLDFAIIFDKLTSPVDTEKIGFEVMSRTKVIFGSKSEDVIQKMAPDLVVEVPRLNNVKEATQLLCNISGKDGLFKKQIVLACDGHPKLLGLVGGAMRLMRGDDATMWPAVAKALKSTRAGSSSTGHDESDRRYYDACLAEGSPLKKRAWAEVQEYSGSKDKKMKRRKSW